MGKGEEINAQMKLFRISHKLAKHNLLNIIIVLMA